MRLPKSRIYYFGMICTVGYVREIGEDALIGAASGKMAAVVAALRLVGRRAVLVSLPVLGRHARNSRYAGRMTRADGFPAIFLPVYRSPFLRKLLGAFALAGFAMRVVGRGDTVLFYNHAVEYILALGILRLRGIAVFQDIEDAPTGEDGGLRGMFNRIGYLVMNRLTSRRKVIVSNQLGLDLKLQEFLAVQGVAAPITTASSARKWNALAAGGALRIHYGGTLIASTGIDLFCSTVKHLQQAGALKDHVMEFVVTGFGNIDRVQDLARNLATPGMRIEVYGNVDRAGYFSLLDSCHASLSLRDPDAEISSTTFPSKVIEITSRGLSLVTTRISDVDEIFDGTEAWFLSEFTDVNLAAILEEMVRNPAEVRRRAASGQTVAQARFSPESVGRKLADFLDAD